MNNPDASIAAKKRHVAGDHGLYGATPQRSAPPIVVPSEGPVQVMMMMPHPSAKKTNNPPIIQQQRAASRTQQPQEEKGTSRYFDQKPAQAAEREDGRIKKYTFSKRKVPTAENERDPTIRLTPAISSIQKRAEQLGKILGAGSKGPEPIFSLRGMKSWFDK